MPPLQPTRSLQQRRLPWLAQRARRLELSPQFEAAYVSAVLDMYNSIAGARFRFGSVSAHARRAMDSSPPLSLRAARWLRGIWGILRSLGVSSEPQPPAPLWAALSRSVPYGSPLFSTYALAPRALPGSLLQLSCFSPYPLHGPIQATRRSPSPFFAVCALALSFFRPLTGLR